MSKKPEANTNIRITPKGVKAYELLRKSRLFRLFWRIDNYSYDRCKPLFKLTNLIMDLIWFREYKD